MYSPWMYVSPADDAAEEALDLEIEILARAVQDRGPLGPRELSATVAAKYWGPGRFRTALREAIAEGRVVRAGKGMLGPPPDDAPR